MSDMCDDLLACCSLAPTMLLLLTCPDVLAEEGVVYAGNWIHVGVSVRAVRAKSTWVAYPCPYDATVAKATKAAYTASTAAGVRFRALLA